MHDDTQVGRIIVMGKALRNGQFPVRWVSGLGYGYGYPIFNFYGPLPYYAGGFLYALGIDGLQSTKIIFFATIIGAAITMYALGTKLFGSAGGIVSSLLYTYAPYHAVQLYIRGALGEAWVMIFLPIVTLGCVYTFNSPKRSLGMILSGIGLSGIIVSHTIFGYVSIYAYSFIILLSWSIGIVIKRSNRLILIRLFLSLGIGLGLSSFFWLPALVEMNATNVVSQIGPTAGYKDHFVCLFQLWDSPWGFGGSSPGCIDGLSFRIGKIHILLGLFTLIMLYWKRKHHLHLLTTAIGVLFFTFVSSLLLIDNSASLWRLIPKFEFVQYPWRFLTFVIFGISLLAGGSVLAFKRPVFLFTYTCVIIAVTLLVYAKLFIPQYSYLKIPEEFETDVELKWRVSKISDEYLPVQLIRPRSIGDLPKSILTSQNDISIDTQIDTEILTKFSIISNIDTFITIHRAYFPGWKYILDGKEVIPNLDNRLPVIFFPKGAHTVELHFTNTPVRTLANSISIATVFLLLYLYGKKNIA